MIELQKYNGIKLVKNKLKRNISNTHSNTHSFWLVKIHIGPTNQIEYVKRCVVNILLN